jgi:ubiquitin carboxyl-terminal hydrolase 9/13
MKRRDSAVADPSDSAVSPPPTAPVIPTEPASLFSALRSLFIHIAQNTQDNGKVPPSAFVKKIKDDNEAFRNNNHQDAHELFNFLLNRVVEDLEVQEKTRHSKLRESILNSSICYG